MVCDGAPLKVLVVDANASSRQLVQTLLRSVGVTDVYGVESTDDAIALLSVFRPDLVLTEWTFPSAGGDQTGGGEDDDAKADADPVYGCERTMPAGQAGTGTLRIGGAELLRYIRHHPNSENPGLPVLVVAGVVWPGLGQQVVQEGASDLIVKPISLRLLVGRIVKVLGGSREQACGCVDEAQH